MIYRTAHRATYNNLNNNLGMLSYRIAQLTSQIASEKRINTPSDDPTGAATVLSTRSTMSAISQYKTNIAVADLWLADSGNAIQSIKETLDEIYAKTEQASSDTYNASQRQIIAEEVSLLFQSLIQFGDTKIGDSYIFAGQKVTTRPFSLQVEAQKVQVGTDNSDKWTGKVVNYGQATFNSRSDLPVQSQNFLIEVVRAGGVDSRYYSTASNYSTAKITGDNYGFQFQATDPSYNNTSVKFVAGPANQTTFGDLAGDGGLTFSGGVDPTNIVFQLGDENPTSTAWDAASNTLTVVLQTNSSGRCAATAADAALAINGAAPPGVTAAESGTGMGVMNVGSVSFNNLTTVAVNGEAITVYLERDNEANGGALIATAADVQAALGADPAAAALINGALLAGSDPLALVSPTAAATPLVTGQPYTLAWAELDPKGSQNGLVWSVKNNSAYMGEAGNAFSVAYNIPQNPFSSAASLTYNPATGEITVNLAVSASIYQKTFVQVYNNPSSGAYQNAEKANEMALEAAILTTANDVRAMVEADPVLSQIVDVSLMDGNSGLGKVNAVARTQFSDGYDQTALFRVSQDGGQTWGPAMSFSAGEYQTGDMFYNSTLGHASMTTNLPGKGNDLIFTASQLGTWGNDVRVEYSLPQPPSRDLSITVGPETWNICVNLATDPVTGKVTTTAEDIMKAINSHPTASQLVTADLADYGEGGSGVVDVMKCTALTVGEPYQVNGRSVITPLGYATGTVSFSYAAASQSCPNIILQALEHGIGGNDIGIRYTTSADPTYYASASAANGNYQDSTTIRYETTADGQTVLVVHLATEALPNCPENDQEAADKWRELYPVYSCTEDRAVLTTAGDIVQSIINRNTADPESAVVWPSVEKWPDGLDSTAKVGPTSGTVWLSGGNETEDASNHGVNLQFLADGTALQVGDTFKVTVGWYRGDDQDIDINASSGYRTTINTTGGDLFGAEGEAGNILDTVQRLIWALEHNDSELIAKELPNLKSAIEQVTTLETKIGTRQIRNQFVTKNLEQAEYSAESLLSTVEDADFTKLITDLKNAQTVYEAVLGATGLTNGLSLLNYL